MAESFEPPPGLLAKADQGFENLRQSVDHMIENPPPELTGSSLRDVIRLYHKINDAVSVLAVEGSEDKAKLIAAELLRRHYEKAEQ